MTPLETAKKNLQQLDHQYLWHPFTQMHEWLSELPLIIERGEGVFLYDTSGNKYIDAVSSIWCNVHGHAHPVINQAIIEQIGKVSHATLLGSANVPSILLAEKLSHSLPPPLTKVFYGDSGSAAVEAAVKMAVQYWHLKGEARTHFIALEGAYHGDTFGSMSLGYSESFHKPFREMLFQVSRFSSPYALAKRNQISIEDAEEISLSELGKILTTHKAQIAACIVEPLVQGAAGVWPHSPRFLKRLYEQVKSAGLLFIADEVAVGFGRTGKMFAIEHAGINPDFLCLGKGLSGGYLPLSATVTTQAIFDTFQAPFQELKQFFHGHTFSGNPVACAAGIANLELFQTEKTLEKLQLKIEFLWQFLNDKIKPLPHVMEVLGFGFFAGIDLAKNKNENYPIEQRIGKQVTLAARKHGILLRPLLDTIVIAPPLSIDMNTLEALLNGVMQSLQEATS